MNCKIIASYSKEKKHVAVLIMYLIKKGTSDKKLTTINFSFALILRCINTQLDTQSACNR